MNFAHPEMFWLLAILLPALTLFLWWSYRRKQALIRQFVQHRLLAQLTVGVSPTRQKLRLLLQVLATTFLLLALTRPQWGFTWEETAQTGRDIVVAIDASKSMLATDIQPTRLQRAKYAALDLMKIAQNDRLALVGFAGTAFLQCPLTLDDEAFRQSVDILDPNILPQGGTAIAEAIDTALAAFEREEGDNHKVFVLFTDGEDHQEGIETSLQKATSARMKIITVGVGTPGGEVIRIRDDRGQYQFLRDHQGNVVKSRLNEDLLQQIATKTGGFYLPLRGANSMELLYERGLAPLPTTELEGRLVKRFREQYVWPLTLAILLLIIEVLLPQQKKPARPAHPATAAPLAKTAALLFLSCSLLTTFASPASAQRKLASGAYQEALQDYKKLLQKRPDDGRLHYNTGVAAYQARDYEQALKSFQQAAAAESLELQQRAYYNLGNTHFRVGELAPDPQTQIGLWEQALKHYDSALKLNSADADARFNREFVAKKIEELKKQQQQEKQQNPQQNNQDQQNDQQDQQQQENNPSDPQQQQQQQQSKSNQQDQQQQQQNSSDQEQNQQSQEQPNQQQAQNQSDQEQKQQGQTPDPSQQSASSENNQEQNQADEQLAADAQAYKLGQMTPQQAKQLLDAQKSEEKALIFLPPDQQRRSRNPILKDW